MERNCLDDKASCKKSYNGSIGHDYKPELINDIVFEMFHLLFPRAECNTLYLFLDYIIDETKKIRY